MIERLMKPHEREGKVTLTPAERREKKIALYLSQRGRCAYCGRRMTLDPAYMHSATLEHITPQPAGCAKDDSDSNLLCVCFACNAAKGSKRPTR